MIKNLSEVFSSIQIWPVINFLSDYLKSRNKADKQGSTFRNLKYLF